MPVRRILPFCASVLLLSIRLAAQNLAGDEALSKVLIPGEEWQEVARGIGFTDGACGDAEGNFFFSDLKHGTVHRVASDGKTEVVWSGAPSISGLKFGPDGRLYLCTQGPKKQILVLRWPARETAVLAEDVQPNDLVVCSNGWIYFTDTAKGQVVGVDIQSRKLVIAARGLSGPNGIALSPDHGTLAVSEARGSNVWTYRVRPDGTLDAGAPYMTLRTPTGRTESSGDGMTVDVLGRYYVTSAVGIQVFDWMGRMGGVIARPANQGVVGCAFAGPRGEFLYVCAGDKVFRRRTLATAAR